MCNRHNVLMVELTDMYVDNHKETLSTIIYILCLHSHRTDTQKIIPIKSQIKCSVEILKNLHQSTRLQEVKIFHDAVVGL